MSHPRASCGIPAARPRTHAHKTEGSAASAAGRSAGQAWAAKEDATVAATQSRRMWRPFSARRAWGRGVAERPVARGGRLWPAGGALGWEL